MNLIGMICTARMASYWTTVKTKQHLADSLSWRKSLVENPRAVCGTDLIRIQVLIQPRYITRAFDIGPTQEIDKKSKQYPILFRQQILKERK